MNQQEIQAYITAGSALISAGIEIVGKVKQLIKLFGHEATEDEVNAIERASMEDSQRRAAEREAMGRASD